MHAEGNETVNAIVTTYQNARILFYAQGRAAHCGMARFGRYVVTSPTSVIFELLCETYTQPHESVGVEYGDLHVPTPEGKEIIKRVAVRTPGEEDNGAITLHSRHVSRNKKLAVYPVHVQENKQVLQARAKRAMNNALQRILVKAQPTGAAVVLRGTLPQTCELCSNSEFAPTPLPQYPELPEGVTAYRCTNELCLHYEFLKPSA